jgi:hypothetical protein
MPEREPWELRRLKFQKGRARPQWEAGAPLGLEVRESRKKKRPECACVVGQGGLLRARYRPGGRVREKAKGLVSCVERWREGLTASLSSQISLSEASVLSSPISQGPCCWTPPLHSCPPDQWLLCSLQPPLHIQGHTASPWDSQACGQGHVHLVAGRVCLRL